MSVELRSTRPSLGRVDVSTADVKVRDGRASVKRAQGPRSKELKGLGQKSSRASVELTEASSQASHVSTAGVRGCWLTA